VFALSASGKAEAKLLRALGLALDKIADVFWHFDAFDVAAGPDFLGDVRRYVLRPVLQCVEGNHANWVAELARYQVGDHGLKVSPLDLGLAVNAAARSKAINDQINGLVSPVARVSRSGIRPC